MLKIARMAVAFTMCWSLTAFGQAAEPELSLAVSGKLGQLMNLTVELGEGVTKAVRVYAQPSGQLIGVLTHANGEESFARTPWFRENFPAEGRAARFPAASFPFTPGAKITIQSQPIPVTDTSLDIYVYGLWPTGNPAMPTQEREDKFTVATNTKDFRFRITRAARSVRLCCGDENSTNSCDHVCLECTSNQSLSCCWDTDYSTGCPFCGHMTASCKRLICTTC
jgi:hypothetical protein